jgi:hypothetical protein
MFNKKRVDVVRGVKERLSVQSEAVFFKKTQTVQCRPIKNPEFFPEEKIRDGIWTLN